MFVVFSNGSHEPQERNYSAGERAEKLADRKTYFFIIDVGAQASLLSGIAKQRGESAQAKIIVVLLRQLLHRQRVQCEHFLSQELQEQKWRQRQNGKEKRVSTNRTIIYTQEMRCVCHFLQIHLNAYI